MRDDAALPLAVLIIIGVVLVLGFLVVAYLTMKLIIVLALLAAGFYLFLKPDKLGGLSQNMRVLVPLVLIALAVVVYTGILEVG